VPLGPSSRDAVILSAGEVAAIGQLSDAQDAGYLKDRRYDAGVLYVRGAWFVGGVRDRLPG
jgi:hypothetical protein